MEIGKEKMVSVTYVLRENDFSGKIIEEAKETNPLTFLFDTGKMLKAFENNLEGKKTGDDFEFLLKAEEAYGEHMPDRILELPLNVFEIDGKVDTDLVKVGNVIPMQDKRGNKLEGLVLEVSDKEVKLDFNHPMAGKTLAFTGKVIEVREATELELNAGLYGHDAANCSSCSGGCG